MATNPFDEFQPATPANPFDEFEQVGPTTRQVLHTAVRTNPDQAARAAQLAKQYPAPVDVLARNLQDVELQAAVEQADATLRTSPKLAKALREKTWAAQQAHDDFPPLVTIESKLAERADRTAMGTLGDVGVVALKSAVGLPQAFVGLADIVTGGYAGKGAEAIGVRFEDAQRFLDTLYSPAQQQANDAVREAEGFINSLGAMLANPSTIATTVGESSAQMLGGAAIGRGLLAAAPKLAPWLAAAFGEGLMGAGATAEQLRVESEEGLLSAKATLAALGSGAGTALFGAVGGRAAQRLGLGDIDTVLTARGVDSATAQTLQRRFIARITGAGISEGVFEELPQSVQEQLWQNWATDKPLGQGVGKAAAQGLLAGLSMGGGFQAVSEAGASLQRTLLEREAAVDRAQAEGQRLTEAFQAAAQSKLRERNPETFRDLVADMGGDATVFVDAQVLAQSATELSQALPSVAEQLEAAIATNSTIEIPVADILTLAPGTPLEQVFLQNARQSPDALSLADATQAGEQAQQFLQQEAERVMQQAQDQQAWQASSEAVKQTILGQLNQAGRFSADVNEAYAALQTNFFSTMAARLGTTPQELYDRYSLKVAQQTPGQGNVLNAGLKTGEVEVEAFHYSKADRKYINTTSFGSGLQGSGKETYMNAADKRLRNRAYFYFDKGTGINPEAGVGGRGHKTTLRNIYDSNADPLRLKQGRGQLEFESAVLDAGFSGYLDNLEGTQSGQVILLGPQSVPVENLGELGATRGTPPKRATRGEGKGRDKFVDQLNAQQFAISGEAGLGTWSMLIKRALPEAHAAMEAAGVFQGEGRFYKDGLIKRFMSMTEAQTYEQSLSSRLPGGRKATEDPLADTLGISWDVALSDETTLAKNVAAMQAYPNFPKLTGKGAKSTARNAEAIIMHMVDNLLWLHDHMPAPMRDRARLWYDGGRKTVEAWADRYGITEMQGAAAIAVLSPQNGWFANVSQAERIADMVFGLRDFAWDDAMTAEADRLVAAAYTAAEKVAKKEAANLKSKNPEVREKAQKKIDKARATAEANERSMLPARGKTLGELLASPADAARWIRVYDQTYNNRAYRVLTPEGGAAGYVQKGEEGEAGAGDATMMWKSYSTIAKAVSVLMDGRAENVHYQIGKEHKVRNFYNNIFAPKSELGYATIDTHAVAAALLRPLASGDTEVSQAFGGTGSASSLATGLNGTYPIYWEAYRRAAEARGLQPREMQSITWEAVRGLFEAAQKKSMKADANAIWERFRKGEITQHEAQREILALAGDITPPSWTEVPFNDEPSRTYEGPAQRAIDERGPVGKAETPTARVMFEVAPDPNDAALTAEWNALSSEERLALSQQVAADIVPKVLKELGTGGDFVMQVGGYMGATNPSMTLRVERPELALTAAKLLGYTLSQDSMMVVTETQVVGTDEVGAVTVKLPDGFSEADIAALYTRVYELEHGGVKLAGGHTTADGQMVILNYSPLSTEEMAGMIFNHLGGEFDVDTNVVYSAFPAKDNYGYGQTDTPSEGDTAARKSPAQRRPDSLRAEATQLLRAALDARAAPDAGGTYEQGEVNGRPEQAGDRAGRPAGRDLAPLAGAPAVPGFSGPDPRVVAVAEQYARDNGIDLKRQAEYVQVDPERAARIAAAYEAMPHAPNDPAVREAYENLIRQTLAQYQALEAVGYRFWFMDLSREDNQDYASTPWNAMRDMRANQRMGVFPTNDGFGSGEDFSPEANPLLADTGLRWPVGGPDSAQTAPVLANDLFRAVHDAFGHGMEGAGFRAQGEENAWQAHVRLFTGSAVGAITSETRGQNSWLNFGPYGESNRTAQVEDTVFADQKTGLMPEWTWTEGRAGDMVEQGGALNQDGPLLAPNGKPSNLPPDLYRLVRTPEFKAWFGDWEAFAGMQGGVWNDATSSVSKVVDENGEPLVVYHGTDAGGFTEFNTPGGSRRGDLGIFLTPNRDMAATYVKRGRARNITRDQTGEDADRVSGVYPLFVNLRNPQEADFEGAYWNGERPGQYVVLDEDGEQVADGNGRMYFDSVGEAENVLSSYGGAEVEPAPDHFETTDSVVRDARKFNNNDGAIIRSVVDSGGGDSAYIDEPSDVFVAFDPTQVKSVENFGTFDPANPDIYRQGPRGTFNPQTLLLTLNENADLSTFLHESGHFFLEVLADIASQSNAPQQIVDDMAATLKWFGVPDLATWNGYTLDQKRPYHEKWAESFEQYLFEGKAPSAELQPLFRRFRSWMINVYKSLTQFMRGRNLKLGDDVRQVFDRLIATDEQIAQAEQAAGLLPDFDATNEAIEQLQARSLRDLKWTVGARNKAVKALQKQAAELRKGIEAEVRAEVEAQPVYAARKFLRTDTKLSIDGLESLYMGEGDRYALLDWKPLVQQKLAGKEGLHPDLVADMFGFASGDQLVRAIMDAQPITEVIQGMTDQRMLERHGDLVDQRAIEEAANEAVHNEARARSLATELKAQSDMLNVRTDTGNVSKNGRKITVNAITAAAKEFAANLAARRRIKDLKNAAWQHRSAEARAGKAWQDATAKGDTQAAVQAKRDQVLNNAAAKALQDAQAETRKILEFFKRVAKGNDEKVVKGGRDPDVVNAMRAILGAYDIAPRLEKAALEYMETVARNDPAMYAALQPGVQGAINNAKPLPEMTMEELRGLNDELRAMWALAKRSRQMEIDGNLLDRQDLADGLLARMNDIGIPAEIPGERAAITNREEAGIKLQFAKSILSRVEQWAERMDGKFGGPFLRFVFQPIKEAADAYRTARVDYRKRFTALVENVSPVIRPGAIPAPELGYTFGNSRDSGTAELLHAILHTGNDSNKRKLLLGRGWATESPDGTLDTSRWDAFIARMINEGKLEKAHYDFAQGVWDLLEEMKPLAQETHRQVFGRYFAEVTANAFDTPFGSYRGGYVPAQTDALLVRDAKLRELAEGENESMAYAFPAAPSGFTKARVEYNKPLLLDLRALAQHMDKVLLFSYMQGPVTDVRRLLTDKGVAYALDRLDPGAYEGMLIPWLNRSARQIVETPVAGDRKLSRFLSAARSRAGMALMFANLSNTFQQITGFSMAAVKVRPGLVLKATAEFTRSPKAMKEQVATASEFMRNRMLNEVGAMNDAVEQILVDATRLEKAQAWTREHAYFLQAAVDNTMSPIIWTAAYNQAIEQQMNHKDAVRFADGVIRQTQGTTLPEDISRFESGSAIARTFTQFVGYFNMMANTNATAAKQVIDEVGLRKGAGKLLGIALAGLLVPIWVAEAIAQAFRGGPDDEDDDDGYLDDWLMAVFGLGTLRGMVAQVPIVGQMAQLAVNRFNDNPADDKFSLSPAVSLIESAVSSPASVYKAIADEGSAQKAVRDVAAAATLITGLPIYGVARPIGYLAGVADERIEPTGPIDLGRGLVTGTASPESKQP